MHSSRASLTKYDASCSRRCVPDGALHSPQLASRVCDPIGISSRTSSRLLETSAPFLHHTRSSRVVIASLQACVHHHVQHPYTHLLRQVALPRRSTVKPAAANASHLPISASNVRLSQQHTHPRNRGVVHLENSRPADVISARATCGARVSEDPLTR